MSRSQIASREAPVQEPVLLTSLKSQKQNRHHFINTMNTYSERSRLALQRYDSARMSVAAGFIRDAYVSRFPYL